MECTAVCVIVKQGIPTSEELSLLQWCPQSKGHCSMSLIIKYIENLVAAAYFEQKSLIAFPLASSERLGQ